MRSRWLEIGEVLFLRIYGHSPVPELSILPAPLGAEPGRAKEESRITCMRMLRTNQSNITRSQPCCSRQCVTQCLFQLKRFFLIVFERKVRRVQAVICIMQRVHFQVRVGVFNCQQILAKISFVIFDIVIKNKSNVV